ncbi:hypothetical protein HLP44_000671 [Shigella sonnei]|nr:hypothetical protein [Shigella sonnei]EFZ5528667.1 hypothetical protein [Shigella sonnei]
MKNNDYAIGLLSVLSNSICPGMVLDEQTADGMIAIINHVKSAIQSEKEEDKTKL